MRLRHATTHTTAQTLPYLLHASQRSTATHVCILRNSRFHNSPSYRNKFKYHTQFGYNPWLLELDPEPYVMLNPADAAPRGIETGDTVRVFNDRGTCTLKAVVNDGVRAGLIVIPKGWQTDQYQDGSAQELTSTHMNPVCFNSYFFDALCEVELAQKGGNE